MCLYLYLGPILSMATGYRWTWAYKGISRKTCICLYLYFINYYNCIYICNVNCICILIWRPSMDVGGHTKERGGKQGLVPISLSLTLTLTHVKCFEAHLSDQSICVKHKYKYIHKHKYRYEYRHMSNALSPICQTNVSIIYTKYKYKWMCMCLSSYILASLS